MKCIKTKSRNSWRVFLSKFANHVHLDPRNIQNVLGTLDPRNFSTESTGSNNFNAKIEILAVVLIFKIWSFRNLAWKWRVELIVTLECTGCVRQNWNLWETEFFITFGLFWGENANFWPKNHFFGILKFDLLPASASLCLFLQQYWKDVKNYENSSIAACDKNDLLGDSVKAHSNQQMGRQKLIGSESCYLFFIQVKRVFFLGLYSWIY